MVTLALVKRLYGRFGISLTALLPVWCYSNDFAVLPAVVYSRFGHLHSLERFLSLFCTCKSALAQIRDMMELKQRVMQRRQLTVIESN